MWIPSDASELEQGLLDGSLPHESGSSDLSPVARPRSKFAQLERRVSGGGQFRGSFEDKHPGWAVIGHRRIMDDPVTSPLVITAVLAEAGESIVDAVGVHGTWADCLNLPRHMFSAFERVDVPEHRPVGR